MKAAIILKDACFKEFNRNEFDILIAADRGALHAIKNNVIPDIAVGDFDSVTKEELELIKGKVSNVKILNPIKDMTDTNEAIALAKECDEIIIMGGIQGKRIEHLFANIIELEKNERLIMTDEYSLIETISPKRAYKVRDGYKFVSIFSLSDDTVLSLDGFKYNLKNYSLKRNDPLGVSNEIIENPSITLSKGRLLIIYTKSDEEV